MLGNWSDSLDHLIHLLVAFVLALPIGWNRARAEQGAGLRTLDRKSTRLNSSHSQISYAVFCLKKKHTVHPHTSLSSLKVIQTSAAFDFTDDYFYFLTSHKLWIAIDRSHAHRSGYACVSDHLAL